MVEADLVEAATETNGYPEEKTVGEEKKVLLRQTQYSNNGAVDKISTVNTNGTIIMNGDGIDSMRTAQPHRPNTIFSNPMKHSQGTMYKRPPSPANGQWQNRTQNYYHKMAYSPYVQNNNYNGNNYRNDGTSSTGVQAEQLSKTNLYIRGLPHHMTDEELANMCKRYGKITSTKAITDKQSNKCKGYGFVDFESPEAAKKACQNLTLQGTQASFAKMSINDQIRKQQQDPNSRIKQNDNIDTTNLYISNLPKSFTEDQLNTLVAPFGDIVSSRILKDQEGKSKGVGFARMETKEQCEAGIKGLHGKPITPSGDALIVKFAEAPNPSKKRTPMFYYPQQWVAGNVEEGSIPTMGIFQPVFSTDAVMSQNGASAIPPTQTPRMFFPSMHMVPMYNQLPNGSWMSPIVPLPINFPPMSPADHALATHLSHLQIGGGPSTGATVPQPYIPQYPGAPYIQQESPSSVDEQRQSYIYPAQHSNQVSNEAW